MSVLNFFKELLSSPFSLDREPPTAVKVKTLLRNRIVIGLAGILAGFRFAAASTHIMGSSDNSLLPIAFIAALFISICVGLFGAFLLFVTFLDPSPQPMDPTQCSELLAFCALHPSIELYRAKVVSQNRTFMQGDYGIMKEGARCLNPKDLQACRTLYEIA